MATAAGINDAEKILYAMRYADLDEAEVWQTVSTASTAIPDWDDFVDQVKELYPGCEGSNRFCRADLHYLVQDSWMASMRSQEDLGEYRRKFTKISSHLVDTGKLPETEWNDLFLQGFSKEVEERIHHRLSITKFDLHPDDPYPMVDVLTTAKFLLTGSPYRSALPDRLSAYDQHGLAGYPHPYAPTYQPATQLPIPPVSTSGSAPVKAEYGMTGRREILCAFCGGPGHYASQCEICKQYIAVNHVICGMDGRLYLLGGRQIPRIPGCKCIQACIDQVEAENAAASQAIVAASTSIPRESAEQSALDPLPHTTVGILSIAEPADATYKVSSSAEMANPDFQPYLVKAWAAYQAAK